MHFNAHASSEYMIPTFAMGVMFQCTVDFVRMRVCVQYFVSFSEDCIDEDKCLNKKKKKKNDYNSSNDIKNMYGKYICI